jgi:CNT family concentrative nucleoside transporter
LARVAGDRIAQREALRGIVATSGGRSLSPSSPLVLLAPPVAKAFGAINDAVNTISAATRAPASSYSPSRRRALPFDLKAPGADLPWRFRRCRSCRRERSDDAAVLLAHPAADRARMAWLLEQLGVGGAVGLSTAANIFVGMVEAPLFIRPYLAKLTRAELFIVMTGGMAGIAGTVLVLDATFLAPLIPDAAAHFVIASVLAAPTAILVSLIMVPETSGKRTGGALGDPDMRCMDAISTGMDDRHRPRRARDGANVQRLPRRNCCSTSSPCCWCWSL